MQIIHHVEFAYHSYEVTSYCLLGDYSVARMSIMVSNELCTVHVDPMPADFEQYYGFTKFALELNELDLQTKPLLPPTDTRLRLDQR